MTFRETANKNQPLSPLQETVDILSNALVLAHANTYINHCVTIAGFVQMATTPEAKIFAHLLKTFPAGSLLVIA
jgi:hypothetical protein